MEMEEDEKKDVVTQTAEETEKTEDVKENPSAGGEKSETKKTFTQEEVNTILKRERKKMPDSKELKAFREWKEAQKTEEEKKIEKELETQKGLEERNQLLHENKCFKAGVTKEYADYVAFKVSKMEGDFDDNLTKFLKENPKYLGQEEQPLKTKIVSSSVPFNGKVQPNVNINNQTMNDLIRSGRG